MLVHAAPNWTSIAGTPGASPCNCSLPPSASLPRSCHVNALRTPADMACRRVQTEADHGNRGSKGAAQPSAENTPAYPTKHLPVFAKGLDGPACACRSLAATVHGNGPGVCHLFPGMHMASHSPGMWAEGEELHGSVKPHERKSLFVAFTGRQSTQTHAMTALPGPP